MDAVKKPIDMGNPTLNDILRYEMSSVQENRFMSAKEKEAKLALLKSQMANN